MGSLGDRFFRVRTRQQLTMVMLQLTPNCIFSYVATVVINIHNFMFMDEIFSMFIMSDVLHGRTSRNHGIREKISQAQFPEFGLARHILGIIRYLLLMKAFQKPRKWAHWHLWHFDNYTNYWWSVHTKIWLDWLIDFLPFAGYWYQSKTETESSKLISFSLVMNSHASYN